MLPSGEKQDQDVEVVRDTALIFIFSCGEKTWTQNALLIFRKRIEAIYHATYLLADHIVVRNWVEGDEFQLIVSIRL